MNIGQLWSTRFGAFVKEIQRYTKYMFNDHIAVVLVFALGGGAFYYQKWLSTLAPTFPSGLVISVIMALVLTSGGIMYLLKEADLVFLLPLEEKMKGYFKRSFMVSYLFQAVIVAMMFLVVAPLYWQQFHGTPISLLLLLLFFLAMKAWNMCVIWETTYVTDRRLKLVDPLIRVVLNFSLSYVVVTKQSFLLTLAIVGISGLYLGLLFQQAKGRSLKWETLVESDQRGMNAFYRMANMFTDVPMLKTPVKRRRLFDFFLRGIPFSQNKTYNYLYARTFIRSGDYAGIYLRLSLIGAALLYFVPNVYMQGGISVLFLYLIGFQLMTLWSHYRYVLWLSIYPIEEDDKRHAFLKLIFGLLMGCNVFFVLIFVLTTGIGIAASMAVLNTLFIYVYTYHYMNRIK